MLSLIFILAGGTTCCYLLKIHSSQVLHGVPGSLVYFANMCIYALIRHCLLYYKTFKMKCTVE